MVIELTEAGHIICPVCKATDLRRNRVDVVDPLLDKTEHVERAVVRRIVIKRKTQQYETALVDFRKAWPCVHTYFWCRACDQILKLTFAGSTTGVKVQFGVHDEEKT